MKRFCHKCNGEISSFCEKCGKPVCTCNPSLISTHYNFKDLEETQRFIKSNFLDGPQPRAEHVVSLDGNTYRFFYEEFLPIIRQNLELIPCRNKYLCTNCAQPFFTYFNTILFQALQKIKQLGHICSVHKWCLFDAKLQCENCGKYCCYFHSLLDESCSKIYCAGEVTYDGGTDYSPGRGYLPAEGSCAYTHHHWLKSVVWCPMSRLTHQTRDSSLRSE